MSAHVVNREHIDLMVCAGLYRCTDAAPSTVSHLPRTAHHALRWFAVDPAEDGWDYETAVRRLGPETADATGQMLICANVLSVHYRYPDCAANGEGLPGAAHYVEPYTYRNLYYRPTTAEVVKLLACYEYQSCEHPGWRTSEAHAYCQALLVAVTRELPGYENAPWGWDAADLAERTGRTVPA